MKKVEIELLKRIGALIRGNWSGYPFDGRDVRDWIDKVIDGKFEELDKELKEYEDDQS